MGLLSRLFGKKAEPVAPRHGGGDMISLVALLPAWEPRSLDAVRADLDTLFPGAFLPPREIGNFVIEGPVPDASYLVQCSVAGHAGMFLIHNVPGQYSDFSDYPAHITDSEFQQMAAELPCWMSVDLIHRHASDEEAWRFVAAAMAKLAPSGAGLLLHPSRYVWARFTPALRAELASGGSPFGTA